MRNIFDIHCHILPEVDDGASSMEESLAMVRMAGEQGIERFIATPHFSSQFLNDNPKRMLQLCQEVQENIWKTIGKEITVYPGQEIFYGEDIIEKLSRGELLTMAGSDYVLLEFHSQMSYSSIYRVVREMTMNQYCPILAHVERYGELREQGRIEELIEAGAYIQVSYHSLCGRWYAEIPRWCKKMLKERNVHFMATDMHSTRTRRPMASEALVWMKKHLDQRYLNEILYENAEKILKNEKI